MYSDKIFPRPFPPVCQFFHPFLRLAPPPLSLFPPIVSFFPVRATAAKSRFVLFPRRTNFPVLCRRLLSPPSCTVQAFSFSRSLISRRPLSFLSFSLCPLFFPVPRRPTFLYCAGVVLFVTISLSFSTELTKKRGTSCYFSNNRKEGDNACGIVPLFAVYARLKTLQKSFQKYTEKAKIALFAFSPCAAWAA